MNRAPDYQTILAGMALILMGAICGLLIFVPVPHENQQLVTFALGAISGALTVGGAAKIADRLTAPPAAPASGPAQ